MADKEKTVLPILNQAQRASLEGVANRRPQMPADTARAELLEMELVAQQGAKWSLTPKGKMVLSLSSNRRNKGGFSV